MTKLFDRRRFIIHFKPPPRQEHHIQKLRCLAAVEARQPAHGKEPTHGGGVAGSSDVATVASEVPDIVNTPHYVKVIEAVKDIVAHPIFEDILQAEVLKLGDASDRCGKAGYGLPLTKSVYLPSVKNTGYASCNANFFDQDCRILATFSLAHKPRRDSSGRLPRVRR